MDAKLPQDLSMLVLADLLSDEVFNGWAVPHERIEEFVCNIEQAAQKAGAIPFAHLDFLDFDNTLSSLIGMSFQSAVQETIQEAESIVTPPSD